MHKVTLAIGVLILIVFTVFGFFANPACDIDRVYLACRLSPFTVGDALGTGLVYAGGLGLCGVTELLGLRLMGREGSIGKWPVIFLAAAVVGAVLIWNT